MKMFTNDLLIDPGGMVKKSGGGIHLPDTAHAPPKIGKVISEAPGDINKGDFVVYFMDQMRSLDGIHRRAITLNGEIHLLMNEALIDGKFDNSIQDQVEQIWKGNTIMMDLQYGGNVHAAGTKVFIKITPKENKTTSGIFLPEENVNNSMMEGTILSMGPKSMRYFKDKDELQIGDVVKLPRRPSGNMLAMSGKDEIWKCNADEISMRRNRDTGQWEPILGWVALDPILGGLKYHENDLILPDSMKVAIGETGGTSQKGYYTHPKKPGVIIPRNSDIVITQSKVMAHGNGVSKDWGLFHDQGVSGDCPFEVGTSVIHPRLFRPDHELMPHVIPIKLEEDQKGFYYMVRSFIIDGLCTEGEEVDITAVTQGEDAVFLSKGDFEL